MSSSGSEWIPDSTTSSIVMRWHAPGPGLRTVDGPNSKVLVHDKLMIYNLLFFFIQHGEDETSISNEGVPLLNTISEITAIVACIEVGNQFFIEVASYLYRVSTIVMELQTTENYFTNTTPIFQSLHQNIILAKDIIFKFREDEKEMPYPVLGITLEQLEKVVKLIGEDLSFISLSTFEDQKYLNIAVRALSGEMRTFHFEDTHFQVQENKERESLVYSNGHLENKKQAPIDTDLYSVYVETSLEPSERITRRSQGNRGSSLPQFMEPLYDTFFCPLTKEIMKDPVTIESGITYEREAITAWYSKYRNPNDTVCPKSGKKIVNRVLRTNMALKSTIEEWKERNEVARIKVAMSSLSYASTDSMIFEALEDLGSICSGKQSNRAQVLGMGILPLLVEFLEYKDRNVRYQTLEMLLQLVADDDEVKEMVAMSVNMSTIIKMLSSNHPPIRHTTLLLLLELSKSKSICQTIGSTNGGILMLISIKYKQSSSDAFASEKADEILRNLESFQGNIKLMAENGYLEPILNHIVAGPEEMQMEMTSYLGEIVLGHDSKILVAERASPALIKMVQSGHSLTRKAAFRALKQISSYHPNCELLVQARIIEIMSEAIFTSEPMDSKYEAATILANIFESGIQIESLQCPQMSLNQIVYETIPLLNNSTPGKLILNLIRVLLCLMKTATSSATVVSVIKETEASYNLIELMNNPSEELQIAAIKLLISLSPYMGHTLADRLCRTRVEPESLIQIPNETVRISEKHALSANFLAKLPHQNLTLNLALVNMNIVPIVLKAISQIQRSGTRMNRYTVTYFEGLVGILVRFTKTLYDKQVLLLAGNYDFMSLFTEFLTTTLSDEVQRLSAIGLENLSAQSTSLSRLPTIRKPKYIKFPILAKCSSFSSTKYDKLLVCPVHRGVCSSQGTFCLLKANSVERLLVCLDHENARVVEAALSAICTLLDDKVDLDKSVCILSEVNTVQRVLNVVREHKQEGIWEKSFWVIERFLTKGGDRSASDISQDRLLPAVLVNAFQHGDENTRQMAERILMNLNKLPNFTTNFSM